ncbi:hypothetical protein R8Z57_00080 [Microbacterium sp. M3]|uniref:Transcriptional regulator, AbiEi antitoxin, Type IV TA system n=1 Tax=Microbacterium arthrosphaerae TaxID=792652 RepID=A0ABU4GVY3_9MICO|nr:MULTISPECIES: hypothetical protein [Microbacterium]MDW4571170.1 hypothetical protein [Microbacterium arthrosphaerae]MDW7605025.1 hypothetical protein [Microbacterium sp. M3]
MPLVTVARTARPSPLALLRHSDTPHPERSVAKGVLVKVRHGVYASAPAWKSLPPWDRYLARVHAAALIHPDAIFCLESAAALLGMPVFGDPVDVHILVPARCASRLIAGVRAHRSSEDRTIVELGGLAMTSPEDTAVDLARLRHPAIGLAMADAALRIETESTAERLLLINEARVSSRGRALARWPLARASARSETAIEAVSRAVIEWLGFPAPELQVVFRSSGKEDRSDFVWKQVGLGGEADGDLKFDGRYGDPRDVLRRQSLRDRRLRTHLRAVAHWGWSDVTAITPLRDILTGAGLRAIAPEQTARLYSLRRSLTSLAPPRRRTHAASGPLRPREYS